MIRLATFVLLLLQAPQAAMRFGAVSGRLSIPSGGPAVGVRVAVLEARPDGSSTLAAVAETDRDGRYRLDDVPPGRYSIVAGSLDRQTYYPGTKISADAKAVTVEAGAGLQGIDFVVTPPLKVTGRVVGLEGFPPDVFVEEQIAYTPQGRTMIFLDGPALPPRQVALVPLDFRALSSTLIADIGEGGSFEFRDVPRAEFSIVLSPSPPAGFAVSVPSHAAVPSVKDGLRVADRDVTDVTLSMRR